MDFLESILRTAEISLELNSQSDYGSYKHSLSHLYNRSSRECYDEARLIIPKYLIATNSINQSYVNICIENIFMDPYTLRDQDVRSKIFQKIGESLYDLVLPYAIQSSNNLPKFVKKHKLTPYVNVRELRVTAEHPMRPMVVQTPFRMEHYDCKCTVSVDLQTVYYLEDFKRRGELARWQFFK